MSAGLATRLRPITSQFPKCLLTVKGTAMLDMWITACIRSMSFERVFVNIHHCPDIVIQWLEKYKRRCHKTFGKKNVEKICVIDETTKLLGTAGTLFWHGDTAQDFFMAYTDTFCYELFARLDMSCRIWSENPADALAGLVTFDLPKDRSAGSIEVDGMRVIRDFSEKGKHGLVGWAGMMFGRKEFFNELRQEDFDLARDVFPRLCGRMVALQHVAAYDIGRGIEEYEQLNVS
jgi:NDP-sugar pyrophosphorylase family protein